MSCDNQFAPTKIRIPTDFNIKYASCFSSGMDTAYYVLASGEWGKSKFSGVICYSTLMGHNWSEPNVLPFSGKYDDGDPHLSKDGKILFFVSSRPPTENQDIWMVLKNDDNTWSEPQLVEIVNSSEKEYSPTTDSHGNLYFASDREGGHGQGDLYVSKLINGKYDAPINLGNVLNSSLGEWNLHITSDTIMLFEASQRAQNKSSYGDIYISFKKNNNWTSPQNIVEINTTGSDLYPFYNAKDGNLFYSSSDSLGSPNTYIYSMRFNELIDKYYSSSQTVEFFLGVVNRSSHDVSIVSLENFSSKKIKVGKGPHEIAVSEDNRIAYVANYGWYPDPGNKGKSPRWVHVEGSSVTRVDLTTMNQKEIPLSYTSPHGILTNSDGSLFWTTVEEEGIVLEMNGETGRLIRVYQTQVGSHVIRSNSDFSKLFVSNIESSTVSIIDRKRNSISHIQTPSGPEGLGVAPDNKYLWILCNSSNQIAILDIETEEIIRIVDSGGRFPVKIDFIEGEAWITNVFSKNLSVFSLIDYELVTKLQFESTPLGILTTDDQVFITLPRENKVIIIDPKKHQIVNEIKVGGEPDGMIIYAKHSG